MKYCAFNLLKRALFKRKPTTIDRFRKRDDEKKKIKTSLGILRKALLLWKSIGSLKNAQTGH